MCLSGAGKMQWGECSVPPVSLCPSVALKPTIHAHHRHADCATRAGWAAQALADFSGTARHLGRRRSTPTLEHTSALGSCSNSALHACKTNNTHLHGLPVPLHVLALDDGLAPLVHLQHLPLQRPDLRHVRLDGLDVGKEAAHGLCVLRGRACIRACVTACGRIHGACMSALRVCAWMDGCNGCLALAGTLPLPRRQAWAVGWGWLGLRRQVRRSCPHLSLPAEPLAATTDLPLLGGRLRSATANAAAHAAQLHILLAGDLLVVVVGLGEPHLGVC